MSIRVYLLGPPRIERDGRTVPVDTRKAIALFAYLATTGRPQSRDHLAALLWPDADQSRARSALRRTLSSLNAALDGKGLRIEREVLAFTGDGVWVDVAALPDGDLAQVDVGSAFLAGFSLKDSPEFDEWQLVAADELRTTSGRVLERLAAQASDVQEAIALAKRWVELDPLHEEAHRLVMRLHDDAGDRTAALRQYRSCVATLERELGVEPLDETTALYEAILEGREASPVEVPRQLPADMGDLPFVGRDRDLAALNEAYVGLRDGHLCVIGGEAGIGKTRLATEFVTAVASRGGVVVDARCHPEEQMLAFGTCVELLRKIPVERLHAAPRTSLAEASRIVPELPVEHPEAAELDSPAARRRLFEGVAEVLASCLGPGGVVFIDDAHHIDESSRDVLRFLVRRLTGRAICVLLTWRTEEVPPAHPLRRMLTDAQRAKLATPVTLQRLSPADVEAIVRRSGTSAERTRTLYEETAGVPFFIAEYLRSAPGDDLPSGVQDLLATRVGSVGRSASQILAAAAVLGRAFDPASVRETSGRTEEEVASALDELAAAGLVAETDDRYDFTHPKLRSYVYDVTTLSRRRILHARAAKAQLRRARRAPELAALAAHHLERSGDEDAAAAAYRQAGEHARSVHANAEALSHLRSALALGHRDDAELHEAIGDLLTLSARYRDAIASYEKAAAVGGDIGVVGRKLGGVHHRLGDFASADAHFVEAEGALRGTEGQLAGRARIIAEQSLNAYRAGSTARAVELAARALEVAVAEDDARSTAQAHNIAGILATHQGDVRRAREHLQASLETAEDLGDLAATAAALNNLALALRAEGAPDIALLQAERALELTRTVGDRHREAALLSNVGDILRDLGRQDEAVEYVKRSVAIFTDIGEGDDFQPEVWKLTEW